MKIVCQFRQNARENLTTASKKLKIPISTIYDRLRKYQGNIITKHTALLDFNKLGYGIRVIMNFKVDSSCKKEFQSFLENHARVNSVYRISNDCDFIAEILFRNMCEIHDFSEELDRFKISEQKEYHIVKDIKREGFMSQNIECAY